MNVRIKITEWCGNERTYHLNVVVSESKVQDFWRPLDAGSEDYLKKVGDLGSVIVKSLMQIDGVAQACLRPYEVKIRKGEAFEWESIDLRVIEILRKIFSERGDEVRVIPLEEK